MRQHLSEKNVKKLATKLGLPIVRVLVRGGTNHRKDLFLDDGKLLCLWPDGDITDPSKEEPFPVKDPTIPDECRR